jgi:uracil-DNA glycosylase
MPDSDIFDKIGDFLSFQEEIYGKDLFLSGKKLFSEDLNDLPSKQVKYTIDDNKSIVKEKGTAYSEKLNENLFMDSALAVPAQRDNNIDAFLRKINKTNTISPDWNKSTNLKELDSCINNCQDCPLGATRTNFVFGVGNPNARIMVIGEAPGADEDAQGEPFVGRAGQLLTKILQAIGLERNDVYICNILKCRPPGNRRPLPEEVDECEPYLIKQIEIIKPEFILALGLTAVDTLLKKKHKMADTRGILTEYRGIKMIVTYHPAALLRNPNLKKPTWEDVQLLKKLLDENLNNKS